VEGFRGEINDYYSRYFNDISTPAEFYFQGNVAQGLKTIEFKDKFFIDALDKNVQKGIMDGQQVQHDGAWTPPTDAVDGLNKFLERILNSSLPSDETSLFAVVFSQIVSTESYKFNKALYTSRHIVHRDGKVYGASIEMSVLVERDKMSLVKYKLIGFVFDDKLATQQAYNLDQNKNQYFMQDKNMLKDQKYVKSYLCQYYKDLEKYRRINIPTDLDCSN
jgi:hypothetical protein